MRTRLLHPLTSAILGISCATSAWAQGPPTDAEEGGLAAGTIEVRLAGFGPQASFEGVSAIALPVDSIATADPRKAGPFVEAPIGSGGRITFDLGRSGLFEVRILDALGMSLSQSDHPHYVSSVAGADCSYTVPCHPLNEVTGLVVNASDDSPISGATLQIDPRFRSIPGPSKQVVTDEYGRYRALTVRTDTVAVDAPGQQIVNMRFGPGTEAGTLRMRPMKHYRFIRIETAPLFESNRDSTQPRFHPVGELRHDTFTTQPDFAVLEFAPYAQAWLDWPLSANEHESTHLLQRFLVKRKGGRTKVDPTEVATTQVELAIDEAAPRPERARLLAPVSPRLMVASDDDSAPWRFSLPQPTGVAAQETTHRDGKPNQHTTLTCDWAGGPPSVHIAIGHSPRASLPALRAHSIKLPGTPTSFLWNLVQMGDWVSLREVSAMKPKATFLPVTGDGPVLISSQFVRGDVSETPTEAVELASCDLHITSSGRPLQGLALRVVPANCAASDLALDLLGETPLVSDANGLVPLRSFLPGEYELRLDAGLTTPALRNRKLDRTALRLAAGQNDPVEMTAGQ